MRLDASLATRAAERHPHEVGPDRRLSGRGGPYLDSRGQTSALASEFEALHAPGPGPGPHQRNDPGERVNPREIIEHFSAQTGRRSPGPNGLSYGSAPATPAFPRERPGGAK